MSHPGLPTPPTGLRALSLLHALALGVLGTLGVLLFIYDAVLANDASKRSLLLFAFGAGAGLLSYGSVMVSLRNPFRNRQAMYLLTLIAWGSVALVLASIPTLLYPLQRTPWSGWVLALPSLVYGALASLHLLRLVRAHQ